MSIQYIPHPTEYWSRLKTYFRFSHNEIKEMIIAILFLTFIFAFDDGAETFILANWLSNFFLSMIIVAIAFFIHEAIHKMVGLGMGYREEHKLWTYGMFFALLITFLTKGKVWIPIVGGAMFFPLMAQRLGKFRYGLSVWYSGMATMAGPLTNVLIALLLGLIMRIGAIESVFLSKFVLFNFVFGAVNMLPIPPLDGFYGFMGGKMSYMFIFGSIVGFIVVYALGLYSIIGTVLLGLFIGFVIMALYYLFVERFAHKL